MRSQCGSSASPSHKPLPTQATKHSTDILRDATRLLSSDEATTFVTREQMLGRLNWILVDEYQDIGEPEYELIAALAGKTLAEDDPRLNLFAVGDDDQNIYAWKGASVRFIRRFAQDYHAKEEYLVENYRSSGLHHRCGEPVHRRCASRASQARPQASTRRPPTHRPAGWGLGQPRRRSRTAKSRSCTLWGANSHRPWPRSRNSNDFPTSTTDWQWSRCAIIARNWADLDPARSACMVRGIPVQSAREELSSFWRARETQKFLHTLESSDTTTIETQEIRRYCADLTGDPWADLLAQALEELLLEEGHAAVLPIPYVRNWLGEWSKEIRRKQQGLLLTSAHRAKGLEFDHVLILDGRWRATSDAEESETPRRLYYVSMTRARETLSLLRLEDADRTVFRDKPLTADQDQRAVALLQPLRNIPSVLERHVPRPDISDRRLDVRIMECTMRDVVLSFAGWRATRSNAHRAISALAPGDSVVPVA